MKSSIKGLGIILRSEPKMLLIQCFLSGVHGLSWVLQVVFIQRFFDSAQGLVQHEVEFNTVFFSMIFMVLAYIFTQVMNGIENYHGTILDLAMTKHRQLQIFKKIDQQSCLEFEDPTRLDYINKAISGGESLVWVTLTLVDSIFFYTVYFFSMSIFLFTLQPILSMSVLFVFIPCVISNMIQHKTFGELEESSAPIRRERDSYLEFVTDLKETRLLGATKYFEKLYYNSLKMLNRLLFRAQLKKNLTTLSFDILNVIGYGIILFMIFLFVMRQEITVGAFVAVLTSITALFNFMEEVISERLGWAFENVASLENYLSFVNEKFEDKMNQEFNMIEGISFENVNFMYPGAEKKTLQKLNFHIKKGETIALVGENGSGKSTLCRLILGIYPPTDGEVKIDDNLIQNISRDQSSAVFQNFCKYKMTIKENISISDINVNLTDEKLFALCSDSGIILDDENIEKGLDTMLGRDFDGIELSGGQWQRIAIARALFRKGQLIILDEPTAAIDPLEETRLYNKFIKICQDKTAVIVTHRLGAAKIADRILVLKDGYLIEGGSHEELMKNQGEYKRMFEAQNQWYV